MANKKFSEFTLKTDPANVDFLVGYDGTDNVRIDPANLGGGGGASDLNGLSDCVADATNNFIGNVPASASGATQNTSLGIDALNPITSGDFNVGIGYAAGSAVTTGQKNTAIGRAALANVSTNSGSTAVGYQAGFISTAGDSVYIGNEPGRANTAAGHISIGYQAGYSQTSGTKNTNIGYQAGYSNTTGQQNTIIGYEAGKVNNANNNTFVGQQAGIAATGAENTLIGTFAGRTLTSGTTNTMLGVGYNGGGVTTGSNNTLIGNAAAASSTSVSNEITLGNSSVTSFRIPGIQSGASDGDVLTFNSSAGKLELQAAGGGGATSLNGLTDCLVASTSTYISTVPSSVGTTSGNTVVGQSAGAALSSGAGLNTYIGQNSSAAKTSGTNNVTIGASSNFLATSGSQLTAVGAYSANNVSGNSGVYIGYAAGAGAATTGANCIVIGNLSSSSSTSVSNEITLGNSSITSLRCAVTSITSLSDERDKSEIKDLEYGLAFIDALQPREFVWDNRPETKTEYDDDGNETQVEFYSANKGKKDFGFIAQEVRELDNDTLRLVYTENEDKLELSYGKLVPILVKAIQELKEEVELLKS